MATGDQAYPRPPTAKEWEYLSAMYPNMVESKVEVLGPATDKYNCIAWSLGLTNTFLWPWPSVANFLDFRGLYISYGYDPWAPPIDNPDVSVWGVTLDSMRHASKLYEPDTKFSTSKLGPWILIKHTIEGMMGSVDGCTVDGKSFDRYGSVNGGYMKGSVLQDIMDLDITLTDDELASVADRVSAIPPTVRSEFEDKFSHWKLTWTEPQILLSSNPHTRAQSEEFRELIRMGSSVIPLVVEKMCDKENLFTVILYDRLMGIGGRSDLSIRYTMNDPRLLEGEYNRALRSVRLWLEDLQAG